MRYPDTEQGARDFCRDNVSEELVPATFRRDDFVDGCWLVTCQDGTRLLAYIADHAFANDFEVVD